MKKEEILKKVTETAEGYFSRGEFFCSEAVVHTVNEALGWPFPKEITMLASGFPIGLGKAGCLCGAVSGGQMALGMALGRKHMDPMHEKMFPIAKDLHDFIKQEYKSTCCRVITKDYEFASPERKQHCIKITGLVAKWVIEKLIDEEIIELEKINF